MLHFGLHNPDGVPEDDRRFFFKSSLDAAGRQLLPDAGVGRMAGRGLSRADRGLMASSPADGKSIFTS
jgi:hypothetical protein